MPRVLSETDVADFRERLCEAAERLFAERGPDAVTMRQLASELGVSPMTPYRYFEAKDDILAAVRASAFNRFAGALEHPYAYKLMFDLNQPHVEKYPELVAAGRRARGTMTGYVDDALKEGVLSGDAEQIGLMFWASVHGAVVLELAGMLPKGGARELQRKLDSTLAKGLR